MSTVKQNKFTEYTFSPEEQALACRFTVLQRQWLQNEMAIAASEKLALTFDPQNPLSFAQQEAELAGKIGILSYLLAAEELYNPIASQPFPDGE